MNDAVRRIAAAFFPERCCLCGGVKSPGAVVCRDCLGSLRFDLKTTKCSYCALPRSECKCGGAHFFDLLLSPYAYGGDIAVALKTYKLGSASDMGESYGRLLSLYVRLLIDINAVDIVCPAPSSESSVKNRGFDHIDKIAASCASRLGRPYRRCLDKICETLPQRSLGDIYRSGNLRGAIDLARGADVEGRTVLLVDDIMTTGATLDECAATLKVFGAANVICATVASTPLKKQKESAVKYRTAPLDEGTVGILTDRGKALFRFRAAQKD